MYGRDEKNVMGEIKIAFFLHLINNIDEVLFEFSFTLIINTMS